MHFYVLFVCTCLQNKLMDGMELMEGLAIQERAVQELIVPANSKK